MTIRQIIIETARRRRVSRYRLSQITGLDEGGLSRYWRGKRDVSTSHADRLLAALQVRLSPKPLPKRCRLPKATDKKMANRNARKRSAQTTLTPH